MSNRPRLGMGRARIRAVAKCAQDSVRNGGRGAAAPPVIHPVRDGAKLHSHLRFDKTRPSSHSAIPRQRQVVNRADDRSPVIPTPARKVPMARSLARPAASAGRQRQRFRDPGALENPVLERACSKPRSERLSRGPFCAKSRPIAELKEGHGDKPAAARDSPERS